MLVRELMTANQVTSGSLIVKKDQKTKKVDSKIHKMQKF